MLRSCRVSLLMLALAAAASGCTGEPKVDRAGVAEPTVKPKARTAPGASDQAPDRKETRQEATTAVTATPATPATPATTSTPGSAGARGSSSDLPADSKESSGRRTGNVSTSNALVTTRTTLRLPTAPRSVNEELEVYRQDCEKGIALACMRAGALEKAQGERDKAKKHYMMACVQTGVVTPTACSAKAVLSGGAPNARGCYEAALMMAFDGDKIGAKAALQCACTLSFTSACKDSESPTLSK